MLELRKLLRIGSLPDATIASGNVEVTGWSWTVKMNKAGTCFLRLEERFMAALITNGTDVMRRLAVAHTFLQRVDRSCFKYRDHGVTVFFSFPVFKLHDLLFKIVFRAQQRRILLLYGRDQGVRINECFLKLYELGVALCFVGRRGDVSASFGEARDRGKECGEGIGHSSSNVPLTRAPLAARRR